MRYWRSNDKQSRLLCAFSSSGSLLFSANSTLEMVRGEEDDYQNRRPTERGWMNWAVVDSRPFLHYLQYLTFRGLGLRHRQLHALCSLHFSINDGIKQKQVFHPETATTHCLEMEGRIDDALRLYLALQTDMPRNNAANLHIRRLTHVW